MWSSSTADQIATNNVSGVKDALIDDYIEKQKTEMSLDKRNEILKQIDKRLNEIVPYVFLWQSGNHRILYWNRFGTPKTIFDKFGREEAIIVYWWLDPDKADKLSDATKNNTTLPREPAEIYYEE